MIKRIIFQIMLLAVVISCWTYKGSSSGKSPDKLSNNTGKVIKRVKNSDFSGFKSTDYLLYRNVPVKYNYELLTAFSGSILKNEYYSMNTGRVSPYDGLIKEFSDSIDWDWRLLASLICQESEFRPDVRSGAGAYGLMQIMPITGRNFGIDYKSSPENNIRAGILYISWLYSIFDNKIPDKRERLNFVLAAYNAGPGHVLDAMRLAEKNGMNPRKWEGSVAVWLLKKSEPQYYNDSVVKNGYFKGKESVRFVSQVLDRFELYKNTIPEEKSHLF